MEIDPRTWSDKQQQLLGIVADRINIRNSFDMTDRLGRRVHITGGPGTCQTEVIIHAASAAAQAGRRVLISCPTGVLVHAYRERLPATDQIIVETCTPVLLWPGRWI